ncbi:hypothetical protein Tco_1088252 [Tanacetum coccineum]
MYTVSKEKDRTIMRETQKSDQGLLRQPEWERVAPVSAQLTSDLPKCHPKLTRDILEKQARMVAYSPSLGTNGGTSNLASQATNSSGSSFWNVDASSLSTTPVIEKIDKTEKLIIKEKVTLVDDEGKPLEKVASSCNYDSDDDVSSVNNDMAKFMAKKDGYGTQSLLEQWTESYENGDYEYDPYDDDMYEGQNIPEKLQAIYDKLDNVVKGQTTREDSPVEVAAPSPKSKLKLARRRQMRTVQNKDAPRQTAWTNKEEIALCKEQNKGTRSSNVRYDNGKWKTVRPNMARFCETYGNVIRKAQESGSRDEDYYNRALLDYEAKHGMSFTPRHCWKVLKGSLKWMETEVPKFLSNPQASKRYKTSGSSYFNTEFGDASINLNVDVGDDEKDEV